MIIPRSIFAKVKSYCEIFPVVAIVGPRQSGKTTFVKDFAVHLKKTTLYLDLENPADLDKLENPHLFFSQNIEKCIIIDEVQSKPDLFPVIRSFVDENKRNCNFIILGSASPDLLKQSSETLAGRIGYMELGPFSGKELKNNFSIQKHHFYGGFPRAYLPAADSVEAGLPAVDSVEAGLPAADSVEAGLSAEDASIIWLDNFIKTYLQRDLPMLGLKADPQRIRRLWEMLAWQTAGLLNYNAISKSLGLSNHTVTAYIDFLEGAFMVRRLQPFHFNIKKRLVKSPKVFITDTGILHRLLRIQDYDQLLGNPLLGNSWETYVINQIALEKPDDIDLYFYRTHAGAEIDLVFAKGLKPVAAMEIKFSSKPSVSRGLLSGIEALESNNNFIITPTENDYLKKGNVRVCGIKTFTEKYLCAL